MNSTATPANQRNEKCFACGKPVGKYPHMADTRDGQIVFVGRECIKKIEAAGERGYEYPNWKPGYVKLYPIKK